jgi:hypothetical protein
MKQAAEDYIAFLASSAEEKEALEEWESASLSQPPRGRKK